MKAILVQANADYRPVEGPAGESVGSVARARTGPGWWPLDDRRKVIKGCHQPVSKTEAVRMVRADFLWDLGRTNNPLTVGRAPKTVQAQAAAKPKFEFVTKFESKSQPGAWHKVKRNSLTREMSCDCKGWIYSGEGGKKRTCRHVREVEARG